MKSRRLHSAEIFKKLGNPRLPVFLKRKLRETAFENEMKHSPSTYIARRIYEGSGRPALNPFAASFRRFSLRLKFPATTLSHLLDGFEMVVAGGSTRLLEEARVYFNERRGPTLLCQENIGKRIGSMWKSRQGINGC